MLRSVTLGVALSILFAACALVEPPPQADTNMFHAEVRNQSRDLLELMVETDRPLPGAAQPASVAPGTIADVTFNVPIDEEWSLFITGVDRDGDPYGSSIEGWAFDALLDQGCHVVVDLWENNGRNVACAR